MAKILGPCVFDIDVALKEGIMDAARDDFSGDSALNFCSPDLKEKRFDASLRVSACWKT